MASRALNSSHRLFPRLGRAFLSTNQQKPTSATGGEVPPKWIEYPRPTIGEYRVGVPAATGPKHTSRKAKVTTLPSGIRVASLTSNGLGRSVGLYVAAGTRDETRSTSGINHVLKFAAFGSTTNKPGYQVVRELEAAGATLNVTCGREHLLFTSEFPPTSVDTVVPLISDMLHPKLSYHEVVEHKALVQEDAERLEGDTVAHLMELVHRQAYRNKGLGQPLTANKNEVHHIARGNISQWVHDNYLPNKAVIVGVGFEHEELVKSVEAAFANKPEHKKHDTSSDGHNDHNEDHGHAEEAPQKQVGKYSGGERLEQAAGHTHMVIAFEGASLKGDPKECAALDILGSVMNGNAGSQVGFGVTARLASSIIPNNQGVHALSAFNFLYPFKHTKLGLFGVYAETHTAPGRVAQQIVAELAKLSTPLSEEELNKGKAANKLSVLDYRRSTALEFIGAQVLASEVDSLTAADVAAAAKKVLSSRPTFVAVGDVSGLPTSEEISAAFKSQ